MCSVTQYHTQSEQNDAHQPETTVSPTKIPFQVQNTANILGFCYTTARTISAPAVCRFSLLTIVKDCFSYCVMEQWEW